MRDRFVVFQLRRLAPVRGENLRARMVKRNELAAIPFLHRARMFSQRKFMILNKFEGFKGNASESCDQ